MIRYSGNSTVGSGSSDVGSGYGFVGMGTRRATGGLKASHGMATLAEGVDSWRWPTRISPFGFTIVKILRFHLEFFVG